MIHIQDIFDAIINHKVTKISQYHIRLQLTNTNGFNAWIVSNISFFHTQEYAF